MVAATIPDVIREYRYSQWHREEAIATKRVIIQVAVTAMAVLESSTGYIEYIGEGKQVVIANAKRTLMEAWARL